MNQANFLRKSGGVSLQVTILTPSVGTKGYEEPYEDGLVIEQAGDQKVEDYQYDGNHCIATQDPNPWRKQANIYMAYASFYNPLNFVRSIIDWKDPVWTYRVMYQAYGMVGLVQSMRQGWGWLKSLYQGPIEKLPGLPELKLEMVTLPAATITAQPEPKLIPLAVQSGT